jgi:undecaprenyl-diphosphatase
VEGLTEFLPISSTFHLIFASKFLGLPDTDAQKLFEVVIQAGAILPVILLFGKEWLSDRKSLLKVAASFVPTAIVGFALHKVIKDVFFSTPLLMLGMFIGVGVIFLLLELAISQQKLKLDREANSITWLEAVVVGLAQALAVIPGVSRAGGVMVAMMLFGFKRDQAAKYSFSLGLPTILAAAAFDLLKMHKVVSSQAGSLIPLLMVGSVVAFVSSYIVIRWFINFLRKRSLVGFGVYRLVVGAGLLLSGR